MVGRSSAQIGTVASRVARCGGAPPLPVSDAAHLREHDAVGRRESGMDCSTNGPRRLGNDPPHVRAVDARCGAERRRKSFVLVGQKYRSKFKQTCDQKVTKRCPNRPKSDQNMVTATS